MRLYNAKEVLFPYPFVHMRKLISLSIIASFAITSSLFAETGDITPIAPTSPQIAEVPQAMSPWVDLNAAPNQGATLAPQNRALGSSLGEFKSVNCNTNAAFATNSCDQCFEAGSVKVGETISGLFDNWLNNTPNILVAYREEQKMPNLVRFGNTTWISNPTVDTSFWKYSSDIVWVQAGSGWKNQYILPAGQSVKFFEADISSGYRLEKTDKKAWDVVGILRFPLVSHVIDSSANESAANTSYECASITLASSTVVAPPPTQPTEAQPIPKDITSTKTGPETLLLIIAAFFIAFGLMFSLRKSV